MLKMMNNEIKSCVLHNLLKADFAPHTFTMVLWDSWTSVSQDKMIKQHEEEALKVVKKNLTNLNYSMPLSLSLTQNEWTKNLTKRVFFEKFLFHE